MVLTHVPGSAYGECNAQHYVLYQVHDFSFHNSVQPHVVKTLSHVFLHKAVGFGDVFGANEVVVLRFLFIAVVIDEYVYQRGFVEGLAFFLLVDYLDDIRAGDREYIAISVVLFKSFFLGLGEQYYIGDEVFDDFFHLSFAVLFFYFQFDFVKHRFYFLSVKNFFELGIPCRIPADITVTI